MLDGMVHFHHALCEFDPGMLHFNYGQWAVDLCIVNFHYAQCTLYILKIDLAISIVCLGLVQFHYT